MTFRFGAFQTLLRGFVILSFADYLICTTPDKVSLSWRRHGDHLCFSCDVKNLSLGVSFQDPNGNTRGHCTAPIPHTVAGHCDSHLKQNIFNETTELIVDRVDCENGLWKCFHGENTNEYATTSVSVSVESKEQKPKDSQVRGALTNYGCALLPLIVGYVIALFFPSCFKFLKNLYDTGYHCVTYYGNTLCLKKLLCICLVVVLPLALAFPFSQIPGVCEGNWWILGSTVGAITTAISYKLLVLWKKSSTVENETRPKKADDPGGKERLMNEDKTETIL